MGLDKLTKQLSERSMNVVGNLSCLAGQHTGGVVQAFCEMLRLATRFCHLIWVEEASF